MVGLCGININMDREWWLMAHIKYVIYLPYWLIKLVN